MRALSLWLVATSRGSWGHGLAGGRTPTAGLEPQHPRGDVRANLVTVKVGAGGKINVFNAAGSTDLIADIAGWYGPLAVA